MKRTLSLTIPSSEKFVSLAINFIKDALSLAKMDPKDMVRVLDACRELIYNAVRHAYPRQMEGPIDIDVRLLSYGVEVSVHDMGMPFDYYRYMESPRDGGLKRIHTCIDELRFLNMGQNGKSFTIYKAHPLDLDDMVFRPYSDLEDESPASLKPASIQIRDYETGDEESISRLIYNNYTYSYYKALFYYPRKIRELNEREEIASVVAETREGHIVGHFALVKTEGGNTAEIGVAVVDPDYKGKGIMNAMLERIINRAKEMKLDAIFGEALMLHPFSQRANLRHGFGESALLLGIVPNTLSLTDPNAVRTKKSAAVLVGYKILNPTTSRAIFTPTRYKRLVETIYGNNKLSIERPKKRLPSSRKSAIGYELSEYTQTGTLVIDDICDDFTRAIRHVMHTLYRKHVNMIYADINLMRCGRIDDAVELLKEEGFVFSGVIFFGRGNCDYLRLQMIASDNVEAEQIVCHSDFCSRLLHEINEEIASS